MNEALVNGPNGFAPSYDIGGALEWALDKWSINAVAMNIGQKGDGNSYYFFGAQMAYKYESFLGEGNYRLIYESTPDETFLDPTFATLEQFHVLSLSIDQQFGDIFGGWIRFRVQTDKEALVQYTSLYSGGINISGAWWGRGQDSIGIAYGYLTGGNAGIDHIQVAEGYIRFGFNRYVALTFDLQYMEDTYDPEAGVDVNGLIASIRLSAEF
jgi:porin